MLTLLRCALIACLCATFSSMSTIAQTPNLINYQAVARNASGALWQTKPLPCACRLGKALPQVLFSTKNATP
jgi:hypothetical protein